MGKNFEKRNTFTMYIREGYKPLWKAFLSCTKKDPYLKRFGKSGHPGLVSINLLQLARRYVLEQGGEETNETSNKADNSEGVPDEGGLDEIQRSVQNNDN